MLLTFHPHFSGEGIGGCAIWAFSHTQTCKITVCDCFRQDSVGAEKVQTHEWNFADAGDSL